MTGEDEDDDISSRKTDDYVHAEDKDC